VNNLGYSLEEFMSLPSYKVKIIRDEAIKYMTSKENGGIANFNEINKEIDNLMGK